MTMLPTRVREWCINWPFLFAIHRLSFNFFIYPFDGETSYSENLNLNATLHTLVASLKLNLFFVSLAREPSKILDELKKRYEEDS